MCPERSRLFAVVVKQFVKRRAQRTAGDLGLSLLTHTASAKQQSRRGQPVGRRQSLIRWAHGRTYGGNLAAMRSASDLRQRLLDRLPSMITRAGMWTVGNGQDLDAQLGQILGDLCYLDERDDEQRVVTDLRRRYGKLGVVGPFVAMFGKDGRYLAEVASCGPSRHTDWAI